MFRRTFIALIAVLCAGVLPASAAAEGTPDISLAKRAPATALLGTAQRVTLHATNPAGQKRGYNLTFRDVLPANVSYVAGSSTVAPRVLLDSPGEGETTLLFENVADLSGNSEYNLSYEVEPAETAFALGDSYTNRAEALVSRKARNKPKFDEKGRPIPGETSYTGRAEDSARTELGAISIEKTEPSPEGELLRGLHDHQTVYTLTIRNNEVKPTKELIVDDYLPAGLEFLACDEADNTTDAPTNPGSPFEYPGSGPITAPGNIPATTSCLKPDLVETEEVDPPGPQPEAVYTHVRWAGLGALEPGAVLRIQYIAAIPIRSNTLTFPSGKPSAAGLGQVANLDNNSGPETADEGSLTNVAQVEGEFEGTTPVRGIDETTRSAEDLAVQKSVDIPTISEGQISNWTLKLETSEYRFFKSVGVDDLVPNGLCPLGEENYEGPVGEPIEPKAECDPVKGSLPTATYSSVKELADGTFELHWDTSTVPGLELIPPSSTFEIVFPTRNRVAYQKEFKDFKPILTGDSWTNSVDVDGAAYARCAPADPTCTGAGTQIPTEAVEGAPDFDHSAAGQQAGGVTIDKTVRENDGTLVPTDCGGTYVQGLIKPLPLYAPGDKICWQLRVVFAADLYAGTPTVTDFLPPDQKYLAGSAQPTGGNTVASLFDESEAEGGSLSWTLGETVESGSKVFAWRFATEMQKTVTNAPEDITGNLMKFTYSNSAGKTFPLRDRAETQRHEPKLTLAKGVYEINKARTAGGAPGPHSAAVHGGDEVTFRVDLENSGNLDAEEVEVWDRLPAGIDCTAITKIAAGGICEGEAGPIVWKGITVAQGATAVPLTYVAEVPSNVAPNQTYTNRAGVTEYRTKTNTGGQFEYFPEGNIDPNRAPGANVGPIEDTATVTTAEASLAKTRETTIEQAGNNKADQATIGEGVLYRLTATVPAGSVVFGSPVLTDPLGPRLALVAGSVGGTVNGKAIPTGGFSVGEAEGNPVLSFPATYANAARSGDDQIVLEFEARVTDVAANARGTSLTSSLTNEGRFNYADQVGVAQERTATATTTVVEPAIKIRKIHTGPASVRPGQIIQYTVTAENPNGTRVSTANDSTIIDPVPAGMTPVNGTTPVPDGGTVAPDGGIWNATARTITWTVAELKPGQTAPRRYNLRVNEPANAGSTFKNVVVMRTTSLPGEVPGERTAGSLSHLGYEAKDESTVTLSEAEIEKAVSAPRGTTIGSPLTYTLNLKLPPNVLFFDTSVEDHLPKGIEYDGTQSITCAPGCEAVAAAGTTLTPRVEGGSPLLGWYFGTVTPAATERVVTIVYRAHIAKELEPGLPVVDGAKLKNTAVGLYNGEEKFSEPPSVPPARSSFSNRTEEVSQRIEVQEPRLTIKKAVTGASAAPRTQPGDKFTYTLTVRNEGDFPAYDAVVKDNNPQGDLRNVDPTGGEGSGYLVAGWKAGDPLEWTIPGPIAPGASVKISYTAALAPSSLLHNGDKIVNVADVPLYFGAPRSQREAEGPRFREYREDPSSSVTLETALPTIALTKTAGTLGAKEAEARIGKPFTWHLEIANLSGVAGLRGVDVLDRLPAGWEYVAGSSEFTPSGSKADPTITEAVAGEPELSWSNVGNLGPKGLITLTFKAIPTTALVEKPNVYVNHAVAGGDDVSGASGSAEGPYSSEDTARANLKTPGLNITKTPDEGRAVAGGPAAYNIEIDNSGNAAATSVQVSDRLEAGNNYVPGTATATPAAGFAEVSVEEEPGIPETRVEWTIASIPAGQTVVIHVPVTLAASLPDGEKLRDFATVESAEQPIPREDEGSLKVARKADVSIEKTGNPTSVVAGEEIDYTLLVENRGLSEASKAVVSDPLPAGVEFLGADAPCVLVGPGVECELGDLPVNFKASYHVHVLVRSGTTAPIVNSAEVTTETEDPKPANNTSTVTTPVGGQADVAIVKSGPTAPVLLGSTFTYTLEVENKGPSDARAVRVEDSLPPQVELAPEGIDTDTGTCTEAATLVECELGTMVAGARATIHVTVQTLETASASEPVENYASVGSTTPDPEKGNNEDGADVTVLPAADLAIEKTAPATVPAGGQLTYSLRVENLGPSDATGVLVTDPLPIGSTFVSAGEGCTAASGTVRCAIGALAVKEVRRLQVAVTVPVALAGSPLVNVATVAGNEGDPRTDNDSSTVTTQVGPAADLGIVKTMGSARAGEPLLYTLVVTNHGPSGSSAVTVHDTLPAGVSYSSAKPSQGGCAEADGAVTCRLGPLAAGASAQVAITVGVGAKASGTLRNLASVEGPEPDPNPANNESAVEGPIGPAQSAPNLHLEKTASTSTPEVGRPFQYRVTVTNRSDVPATNVRLADTLNGPVRIERVEIDKGSCKPPANGQISCLISRLAPHAAAHLVYTVVAERPGKLTNEAGATAGNGESAPADNRAVKNVKVLAAPATYSLTKAAARRIVPGGGQVGFTITLQNGPTAMTGVVVCDRLPAGLVFVRAPGASFIDGRSCWKRQYLAAHARLVLHLTAQATRGYRWVRARNLATADAGNAPARSAAAMVRIKPAFGGVPGGVTG